MPTGLWRALALIVTVVSLIVVVTDTTTALQRGDDHLTTEAAIPGASVPWRVLRLTGAPGDNGGLQPGDVIAQVGGLTPRVRFGVEYAGTTIVWNVTRGTAQFQTTTRVTPIAGDDLLALQVYNVVRIAMLAVALLLIVRRPDAPEARALVAFLTTVALTMTDTYFWMPDRVLGIVSLVRIAVQFFGLAQAVHFACIFPFRSASGFRAALRRANPWISSAIAAAVMGGSWAEQHTTAVVIPPALNGLFMFSPLYFFAAICAGFSLAAATARGVDRQRVLWAFGSLGVGFSGPLVQVFCVMLHRTGPWMNWLGFTLIAIPVGLAYSILRHRTIDIGFVVSRALVLTIVSFLIVAAFGLLERALGKIFIDASHIASRSVEIALALGLGFSLRTLHARVESVVDRMFFARRRRALASLREFASEVYHITSPEAAVERTVAVTVAAVDAESAALYLLEGGIFRRAAGLESAALPADVGENDPLFVRLRTTRAATGLRHVESIVRAEVAFPMFVRGTLVGTLVLAPKRSGEGYDPEEMALLADVAQRSGLALDALQSLAIRRELEGRVEAFGRNATGGVGSAF